MRRSVSVLAALIGLMAAGPSRADFITYTGTATASGSLGPDSFADAAIAFTFAGDTANISPGSDIDRITLGTATVQVTGLGTATFSGATEVLVNRGVGRVAFVDDTDGTNLFVIQDPAFGSYHLADPIGPLSGTVFSTLNQPSGTSRGNLVLTAVSGTGTFRALRAVPEPASLALVGIGGALMVSAIARRRREWTVAWTPGRAGDGAHTTISPRQAPS